MIVAGCLLATTVVGADVTISETFTSNNKPQLGINCVANDVTYGTIKCTAASSNRAIINTSSSLTFKATASGYSLKSITLTWRDGNNYTPTLDILSVTNATLTSITNISCNTGAKEVVLSSTSTNNNYQVTAVTIVYTNSSEGGGESEDEDGDEEGDEDEDTPGTDETVIFNWTQSGSNGFSTDMTNLNATNQGSMTVGTSIYGRKLGDNNVEGNNKGYKLGNNNVCIEIQGTSNFVVGDKVTIQGVCGGDGARAFAIAPVTTTDATTDTALTNTQANKSETLEYVVYVKQAQAGEKIRIFRMAGKTMYVSAIKVTRAGGEEPEEVAVTSVSLNKTSTTINVGSSETLTATVLPTNATNKNVSWTTSNSAVATVNNGTVTAVGAGTATITVTSVADNTKSATCTVTVPEPSSDPVAVTSVTLSKYATSLNVGATETLTATVLPDNATIKTVTWSSDNTAVATVNNGTITAVSAGTATITATSDADNTKKASCTVAVTAVPTPPVPSTDLALHMPDIYEAEELDGGYRTNLVTYKDGDETHEYEVYYWGKAKPAGQSSDIVVCYTQNTKDGYLVSDPNGSASAVEAQDGWFRGTISGSEGSIKEAGKDWTPKATAMGEFADMPGDIQFKGASGKASPDTIAFHIKGYNQFSFVGYDGDVAGKNKNFIVLVDDTVRQFAVAKANTIRRFNLTTGEHVIKITAFNSSNCKFFAFSLRVAQEPRTRYIDGNDSTQEVLQTTAPQPVYYYTKYNSLGETRLEWDGPQGTGFTLDTVGSSAVGDTLALTGTAQCPVGEYHYFVKTYFNGAETSSVPGKIKVTSLIKPKGATQCEAYQNMAIDDIRFTYYALSENDITLSWENDKIPAGITGHGANGSYVISGTPTQVDTFVYTISVLGGNSISDTLFVDKLDLGHDPILYLYKNDGAKKKDGIFKYLTSQAGGNKNLIALKAQESGKRPADQYSYYKWILISEDVDADNKEVLAIARGEVDLPVLNMKSFTYAPGRLNWGEPDNGSLTQEGRFITVFRPDHPIFQALNKHQGEKIMVLDTVIGKGLMPIDVDYDNTLCLATALTRNIDKYYEDGPERTILHEVPRQNGKKYICFPIGMEGSNRLSKDGKRLLDQTITYLLSNDATIKAPSLAITSFLIGTYSGVIDDVNNLITINVQDKDSDLVKAAEPVITLADPMTFVKPNSGEEVNFLDAPYGIRYVVSDYVTKRYYNVIVRLYNPQGIDNIEAGTWVNIFDVFGRKVATTNQDIRTMDLPHGMYIVVTESGQTVKIMR